MNGWQGYLAGLVSAPLIFLAGVTAWDELTPGLTYECWRCGYVTGELRRTPRIVSRLRIRWHRTAHRLRLVPR